MKPTYTVLFLVTSVNCAINCVYICQKHCKLTYENVLIAKRFSYTLYADISKKSLKFE